MFYLKDNVIVVVGIGGVCIRGEHVVRVQLDQVCIN